MNRPLFRRSLASWIVLIGVSAFNTVQGQELNCRVQVIAPQIANVEGAIFESLEEAIQEFVNGRRWTNDEILFEERIECNMQITISEAPSATSFKGSIQVQSSRPVFNSDYNTPMLLVNDGDFEIVWDGSSNIQFSPDQYRDNLSSILAYYAFMVLGMDYDSMVLDGGTPLLSQSSDHCSQCPKCRTIRLEGEPGTTKSLLVGRKHAFTNFSPCSQLFILLSPNGP